MKLPIYVYRQISGVCRRQYRCTKKIRIVEIKEEPYRDYPTHYPEHSARATIDVEYDGHHHALFGWHDNGSVVLWAD